MPRKKEAGRATMLANPNTNLPVLPERFAIGGTEVRPLQLFENPNRHPHGPGSWEREPDKLAWCDAATGKDCILLRQHGGEWGGYVGVSPDHPLWGFSVDAVPSVAGIHVHGPLDYAESCEVEERPQISVCHLFDGHTPRNQRIERDRSSVADDTDPDIWWFGFTADQPGDLIPNHTRPLEAEEGRTYRDINYMYGEVTKLAAELHALEDEAAVRDVARDLPAPDRSLGHEGGDDV